MFLKFSIDKLAKVDPENLSKLSQVVADDVDVSVWERLVAALFPTGWAFRYPLAGFKASVLAVLAKYKAQTNADALKILTSLTPLNAGFDIDDVRLWETRLGIISGEGASIENRKLLILRKQRHPGTQVDRAHYLWIQKLIQDSGFVDAFVHENRFGGGPYAPIDPQPFLDVDAKICATYLGQATDDANFSVTANPETWANMLFIGGAAFGEYINIPESKYPVFRQTVLSVKPAHVAAILLVKLLPY